MFNWFYFVGLVVFLCGVSSPRFASAGALYEAPGARRDVRICIADSDGEVRAIDTRVWADGDTKPDAAQRAAGTAVYTLAFVRPFKWAQMPVDDLTWPIATFLSSSIGHLLDRAFRAASPALVLEQVDVVRWKAWDRNKPCQPEPKPAVATVTQLARICIAGGRDADKPAPDTNKPPVVMAVDLKLTVSPSDNPARAVAPNAVQDAIGTASYGTSYRWEDVSSTQEGRIDIGQLEKSEFGRRILATVRGVALDRANLTLHEGHITRVQKWEQDRCEPMKASAAK